MANQKWEEAVQRYQRSGLLKIDGTGYVAKEFDEEIRITDKELYELGKKLWEEESELAKTYPRSAWLSLTPFSNAAVERYISEPSYTPYP